MNIENTIESLNIIKPELTITIALVLVVLFDLIFKNNKKIIPYIGLGGLAIAMIFTIQQIDFSAFAFTLSGKAENSYGMLSVDPFSAFFKILILLSSAFVIIFSFNSDEVKKTMDRSGEYYALIFGMILGMMFMVTASNLILIYLSLELVSLSSYVLAGFTKLRDRNSEAALKYIIYGAVASGLMLFGISIIYGLTGSTNLYVLNAFLQNPAFNVYTFSFAVFLIFAGIGFKISAAPFHFWTPDVYEGAPITITAFLSVASKAAGFALLIRFIRTSFVMYVDQNGNWEVIEAFDWQAVLVIVSILTMTLGNFAALWQDNLKRMLAYSSIAHAGYILLGLVVLSNQGLIAILIYFFIYTLMNLGAFYIVMLIANKTGSENIDDYDGLGYTAPFLGVSLTIFLVSLTGLPPTAGFIAKVYIFVALVDAQMIIVAAIALLNTVVSLYYYIRVLKHMFLTDKKESTPEIPQSVLTTVVILALVIPTIFFGLYFTPVVNFAKSCITMIGM
jgi:NADH-quinone oxidoreductase subunit N